jgi:hypothetical protein
MNAMHTMRPPEERADRPVVEAVLGGAARDLRLGRRVISALGGRRQLGAMELARAAQELGAAAGETFLVGGRWPTSVLWWPAAVLLWLPAASLAHVGSHRESRERRKREERE